MKKLTPLIVALALLTACGGTPVSVENPRLEEEFLLETTPVAQTPVPTPEPEPAGETTATPELEATPTPVSTPVHTPAPTPTPVEESSAAAEPDGSEHDATPAVRFESESPAARGGKAEALACVGRDVSALVSAVGQPDARSYAPSCLGDGEDGEWNYNGFTVYTYREDGAETVQDVE